jgi:hypothetical protein
MGAPTLLPCLPGGDKEMHNFFKLKKIGDEVIAFDAAGALNQFARHYAEDYLKGGYDEALKESWLLYSKCQ